MKVFSFKTHEKKSKIENKMNGKNLEQLHFENAHKNVAGMFPIVICNVFFN